MKKILIGFLVISTFLLFSCAGKKASSKVHGQYYYGVIPVKVPNDFI